jgi:hypothetical protein
MVRKVLPGQNGDKSDVLKLPLRTALFGLLLIGVTGAGAGGSRSRAETAGERLAKRDQTANAIRVIVAESHARFPRDRATAVGAAHARYSSRLQDSILEPEWRCGRPVAGRRESHILTAQPTRLSGMNRRRV